MSENPTSSNREASRRTVGEVVTFWIRSFRFVRGTTDYSLNREKCLMRAGGSGLTSGDTFKKKF